MQNWCDYIISFIMGLITSIIGVFVSLRIDRFKREKEKEEKRNKQSEQLIKIMYDIRDWARTLNCCNTLEYPERYVSSKALYNKLTCDEIPVEHRDLVFQIANVLDQIEYELGLPNPNPNPDTIRDISKIIGDIAQKLAKEKTRIK